MKNKTAVGNSLKITGPSGGLKSGDPYVVGNIALVASTDIEEGVVGSAERRGVFELSAKAIDGAGSDAIALGDKLFYVDADTPKISKKDTGVFYGYAWGVVEAGATATINVVLAE